MVLNAPEQCDSCEIPFCKHCIAQSLKNNLNCPYCKEIYVGHKFNKRANEKLQEFTFLCKKTGQVRAYNAALEHG